MPFVCDTAVVNDPLTADPAVGVSVATFVYDGAVPAAAVIENVRPEFAGNVASVAVTVFAETDTLGHMAPPVAATQLGVPVIVRPTGSGSLRIAPFDAFGPPLYAKSEYAISPPGLVCVVPVFVSDMPAELTVSTSVAVARAETPPSSVTSEPSETVTVAPKLAGTVYAIPIVTAALAAVGLAFTAARSAANVV